MPAPVTHIVLALSVLPLLPDKDPKEFILGTSFPDIRYLHVIDRHGTHDSNPSWQGIVDEPSSFRAGMELHALVDILHDRYMARRGIYNVLPLACKQSSNYLKLFEDILLYNQCQDWKQIATYFDTISEESLRFIDQPPTIELWYSIVKQYISQAPTTESIAQLLDTKIPTWYGPFLRFPIYIRAQYMSSVLMRNMHEFMQNHRVCDTIFDFYYRFPELVETYQVPAAGVKKQVKLQPQA